MNSYTPLFSHVLLPILAIMAVIGTVFLAYCVRGWRRLARAGMNEIDRMTGREFEECLEFMFRRLGYQVLLTPYTGDWGADLIVTRDGIKTAVQAKHSTSERVGVRAVQEVVAAKEKYECGATMVVTNRGYTLQAMALAKPNRVVMCDRNKLVDMLNSSRRPKPGPAPAPHERRSETARCHECGEEVSEGVRAYCADKSERFGGRTFCMRHQRVHANRAS